MNPAKKIFSAIMAAVVCAAFSSCKSSDSVGAGITDLIEQETEETVSEITSETKPASVTVTEAQTKTSSETTVKSEPVPEAVTETQQTAAAKASETEAASEAKAEASSEYKNIGMISEFNFNYFYPETEEYITFNIYPRHSSVYVITSSGNDHFQQGVITDNQLMKFADTLNGMKISQYNGYDNYGEKDHSLLLDWCSLDITDTDGKITTVRCRGDIPDIFNELIGVLDKLLSESQSDKDLQEKARIGIDKAVDAMIYCRSYLTKYLDLGGDPSEFAGRTIIITEKDTDPLGEYVVPIPDDWYGYAFVKFTSDGTDVEYANWSETKEGLSEEKLIYDDLEAFYIENGTIIGSTLQ